VETEVAALVQLVTDRDGLAVQFDRTDAGKRFVEAWKRARIIVDTGGGDGGTPSSCPPPSGITRTFFWSWSGTDPSQSKEQAGHTGIT
jgi:hypothetical protein